jgi:hypothetical protein
MRRADGLVPRGDGAWPPQLEASGGVVSQGGG